MSFIQTTMSSLVERLWYGHRRPLAFLTPLSWLYRGITEARRRAAWEARNLSLPVPVIVVGNITAGGTGKSPLLPGWSLSWQRPAGGRLSSAGVMAALLANILWKSRPEPARTRPVMSQSCWR